MTRAASELECPLICVWTRVRCPRSTLRRTLIKLIIYPRAATWYVLTASGVHHSLNLPFYCLFSFHCIIIPASTLDCNPPWPECARPLWWWCYASTAAATWTAGHCHARDTDTLIARHFKHPKHQMRHNCCHAPIIRYLQIIVSFITAGPARAPGVAMIIQYNPPPRMTGCIQAGSPCR